MINSTTINEGDYLMEYDSKGYGSFCVVEFPNLRCFEYVLRPLSIFMRTHQEKPFENLGIYSRVSPDYAKVILRVFYDTFFEAMKVVDEAVKREKRDKATDLALYRLATGGYIVDDWDIGPIEVSSCELRIHYRRVLDPFEDWELDGAEVYYVNTGVYMELQGIYLRAHETLRRSFLSYKDREFREHPDRYIKMLGLDVELALQLFKKNEHR
ncbi:MAG: hypothetical protein IJ618_10385 [Prevotella sp.]|nr:hypothetical protein [Prevotella sp.]